MERRIKVLDLPLKKEWYEMIESGKKREEYREIKSYWYERLYQRKSEYLRLGVGRLSREDAEYCCDPTLRYILTGDGFKDTEQKPYTHVRFRYGYTKRTMAFVIDSITIGLGKPELGAPKDKEVFIIKFH